MKINHIKIRLLKKRLLWLKHEHFKPALSGTHHSVVISQNYVIRERKDRPELIRQEARFLQQLHHPLIPKIIWVGKVGQSTIMVENYIPGITLDKHWKQLSRVAQSHIVGQVLEFLKFLRQNTTRLTYSVATSKTYPNFTNYLTQQIAQHTKLIKKCKPARALLEKINAVITDSALLKLFITKPIIVHGDLINHNLLTDGKNLTGVLDFELALFGDRDYDICRLFYYQECAIAYHEQGKDPHFEATYMKNLTSAIIKSTLIKNLDKFWKKYQFIRAFFILGALAWAVNSDKPQKNIKELEILWNKNRVKRIHA
jgi:aminoglycoside phosphotransferase (APT) family kinase protein